MRFKTIVQLVSLVVVPFFGIASMSYADEKALAPAVIKSSSIHNTHMIEQSLSDLLFGRKVSIGAEAFVNSHVLLLDKQPKQSLNERGISGRSSDNAMVFTLWKREGICWLRRESNQQSISLPHLRCKCSSIIEFDNDV